MYSGTVKSRLPNAFPTLDFGGDAVTLGAAAEAFVAGTTVFMLMPGMSMFIVMEALTRVNT